MNFWLKRFSKKSGYLLVLFLLVIANCSLLLADTTVVGNYTLIFNGVSYEIEESTSTWCYTLLWNGTPSQLSHLVIQLGECAQVLSAFPENIRVGLDGSTEIFGIKWDTTIPANIPTQFCFTLNGLYVIEPILFAAKAGSDNNISNIAGASLACEECQVQITCPPDIMADCSAKLESLDTGVPQVQGNCPPFIISFSDEELAGDCESEKTIQRTWVATDISGMTARCQQLISFQDTTPPTIACASSKIIFHPNPLAFDTPEISDNCDTSPALIIVSTTGSATDCPSESIYIRTWEAIDACGNVSAQCSQTVQYQNRAPVLTLSNDKTVVREETLVVSVLAQDPDGTIPALTVLNLPPNAAFQNNLDGSGSLIFTPDYFQVGVHAGITFIATDGCLADTEIIDLHVFVRHDSVAVNVQSPVNLVIVDPKLDSIGIDFNTILEGSSYDTTQDVNNDGEKDDVVKIPNPYLGIYQVRVVPTDTGQFSAGIRIDGNDQVQLASNVVIPSTDTTFEYQAEVFPTLRGDMNSDTKINLIDIIFLVNYIFKSGPASNPLALSNLNCDKKGDGTDNINLQDIIYLVNYIFKAGPHPCS